MKNFKRKVVSIIMMALLTVSLFSQVVSSEVTKGALSDMTGHWAEASVTLSMQKGYVNGYEDGTFRPDQSVTRAEFVKMVDVALGVRVSGVIEGGEWYLPYVNAAVSAGFHQWSDFNTGTWNTPITRQEMARIAVRAAGIKSTEESLAAYMYEATKCGLIRGLGGSKLAPEETTTRAQSVTVIERILALKAGGELPSDKYAVSQAEIDWRGTNLHTVFGYEPIELPFDIPWDDSLTFTVHQYIIADMTDPDDPLAQMIRGFNIHERTIQGIDENYVFAYKMSVNILKEGTGWYQGMWGFMRQAGSYRDVFTDQDLRFNDKNVGIKEGWMIFQRNKKDVDGWLSDDKTLPTFRIEIVNRNGSYPMHIDPYER